MINGPNQVYVERRGKVVLSSVKFRGDEAVIHVIKKILAPLGRRCDASSPLVDARLPDGSRVNIVIPPLALKGPTVTIRKFSKKPLTVDKLIDFGSLTLEMGAFLEACVRARLNVVVSGGTGSGKTTTLNAISGFIPDGERIVTIEDSAELQLQQDHVVSLETRPPNVEGVGEVTIRDLVKNSLRMRPERVIIGECRGGETLDMLQAMNTGHDGSLTTGHANTPVDMVRRLETMVLMAGMNLPIRNIREQVASAVQLIVQQNRLHDGSRRITAIAEVRGMNGEHVDLANIFEYVQEGADAEGKIIGHHRSTGAVPKFLQRLRDAIPDLPDNLLGSELSVARELVRMDRERMVEEREVSRAAAERAASEPVEEVSAAASLAGRPPFSYRDALLIPEVAVAEPVDDQPHKARTIGAMAGVTRAPKPDQKKEEAPPDPNDRICLSLMSRLNASLQFENINLQGMKFEDEKAFLHRKLQEGLAALMAEEQLRLSHSVGQDIVLQTLKDVAGLGPIQGLLDDPTVSEVMVNGPKFIYVERKGKLILSDVKFKDDGHVLHVVQKIVAPLGRRCDASQPIVDARLRDGSRVNAVIPPIALNGPCLTIRKFSKKPLTMESLLKFGSLSENMLLFLKAAVHVRLNIVVSGGTGSGKTTTLNAISGFIPEDERIVTIEDAAELQLQQDHVVGLETRPPNIEGSGAVAIRDLVKNSLRMRPERIIVGECRGGETLDMLQAMNTGHDGSLTTGHANAPKDMIARIETMVMMAGMDLPIRNIREQIASAIHLIVQQDRLKDGTRKISAISEICGFDGDGVKVANIFEFAQEGLDLNGKVIGAHRATGYIPRFVQLFRTSNVHLPDDVFGPGTSLEQIFQRLDEESTAQAKADHAAQLARAASGADEAEVPAAILARLKGKPAFHWLDCFPFGIQVLAGRPTGPPPVLGQEARERDKLETIRGLLFDRIIERLAEFEKHSKPMSHDEERRFVLGLAMPAFWEITKARGVGVTEKAGRDLIKDLVNEVAGFGPIQVLLDDPEVSEVMVNGPWQIYCERKGRLTLAKLNFRDDSHVMRIINKIVAPLGRRCDVSSPLVDARLPDGSRVNAVIPPLALNGPSLTIRKFSKKPISVDRLVQFGTLTPEMAMFLDACVRIRLNMVISGGTGSGKTTTLNAISGFIPEDERIITIEDAAELQLQQDHVVGLESRPPNVEGTGAVTIRELVKNTLRMRPERIIVGECRAGETLDMLQAMNTGHDGSLTSAHANTPTDMTRRLETMVMMAGMDLPLKSIREQIANAVNLIVQQSRLHDGQRKITYITEVHGLDGDKVRLVDIFKWYQLGVDENGHIQGEMRPTGIIPSFVLRFKTEGMKLPDNLFGDGRTMAEIYAEADSRASCLAE
jgi:pilus assembly protein CpaF